MAVISFLETMLLIYLSYKVRARPARPFPKPPALPSDPQPALTSDPPTIT